MKKLLLLICICWFKPGFAQFNLVPNYSFEDSVICPNDINNAPMPKPWYIPSDFNIYSYFNSCGNFHFSTPYNLAGDTSFQYPKTGNAYAGIETMYFNTGLADNRIYIQVKLKDSLFNNKRYYCEFWVNLVNPRQGGTNNTAMLFTKKAMYVDTFSNSFGLLTANPQILNYSNPIITDTLNWVKISGIYTAQGGEQFITLGNFKDDANTQFQIFNPNGLAKASYYVDDVSVIHLDSFCLKADAGKDTAITIGDSVFIGSYTNGLDSLKWLHNNTVIDSLRPGFWVKPTVTTSYILQQVVNGCYSADTVVVTVGTVPLKFLSFSLFPSFGGVRGGWVTANEINVSHFNIQRSLNGRDFINIGKVVANNKSYNEYSSIDDSPLSTVDGKPLTLYYRIESIDFDGKKQYSQTRTLNLKPQTLNSVSIYPNPAKDVVTITRKDAKELLIIDYLGRTVINKKIINNQSTIINVQGLNKGVYVVKAIVNNGDVKTEKLVIE